MSSRYLSYYCWCRSGHDWRAGTPANSRTIQDKVLRWVRLGRRQRKAPSHARRQHHTADFFISLEITRSGRVRDLMNEQERRADRNGPAAEGRDIKAWAREMVVIGCPARFPQPLAHHVHDRFGEWSRQNDGAGIQPGYSTFDRQLQLARGACGPRADRSIMRLEDRRNIE